MGRQYWTNPIVNALVDGTTLTTAAAASCIPAAAKFTLPQGFWEIGKMLRLTASGRISCVVTTPGTARYDVRFGAAVVFDSQAMGLNIVAKTNVSWFLQLLLTCRTIGSSTAATVFGQGMWTSDAAVNGNASFALPFSGTAPAVGTGFDSTTTQLVDMFFTQTVATGSMTLHQYCVEELM